MASFERKRVEGKTAPALSGGGGGCLLGLGVPFLLVGSGLVLAGLSQDLPEGRQARMTMTLLGSAFAVSGLFLMVTGLRQARAARRRKRQKLEHPDEPWFWDYEWNPTGVAHSAGRATVGSLFGLLFLTIFLSPFNWVVWDERIVLGMVFVGLFDLVLVAGWVMFVYQILQGLKFGNSGLAFRRFPFFLGETLDVALLETDRLRGLTRLTVTLRCFEMVEERSGNSIRNVLYSVYEDVKEFGPEDIYFGSGSPARILTLSRRSDPLARLELSFDLPSENLHTDLGAGSTIRFWELETTADLPGIDYAVQFLLPIYSRTQGFSEAGSRGA